MSFIKSFFTGFKKKSMEKTFDQPVNEYNYNKAKEEFNWKLSHILIELHDITKFYLKHSVCGENSWETKEFWLFCNEAVTNIKEFYNQIHYYREALWSSTFFYLDELPNPETILKINEIMTIYFNLLALLLQLEVHWQSSLHSHHIFLNEIMDISAYDDYVTLTQPRKPKMNWDGPSFVMSDYYLMQEIFYRLQWIYEHPVHNNQLPYRSDETDGAEEFDEDTDSSNKTIVPNSSSTKLVGRTTSIPVLTQLFCQHEQHIDQLIPGCSKNLQEIKHDSQSQISEKATTIHSVPITGPTLYKAIPSQPCLPGCLCYHCYVLNTNTYDSNSTSDEPDTLTPGWKELKKKKKKSFKVIQYNSSFTEESSNDDENESNENQIRKIKEEMFGLQLNEFENIINKHQKTMAQTFWNSMIKYIVQGIHVYWQKFRNLKKVYPEEYELIEFKEHEHETDLDLEAGVTDTDSCHTYVVSSHHDVSIDIENEDNE